MLFATGLRAEADGETIAVQCLTAADPVLEVLVVRRPGWHEVPGCADPIFVAPSGAVFGGPDRFDLELAAAVRMAPDVAEVGSLNRIHSEQRQKRCPIARALTLKARA
jgi:hypothetical protein